MSDPAIQRSRRSQSAREDDFDSIAEPRRSRRLARVLFVDDDRDLLAGLRAALRKEPFAIETASSAAQALWTMSRLHVDVVVSDEQMPRVSGSELLSVVRTKFPDTVRIVLTGQASLEAAIRAINRGEVFRFLTKPCSPSQIAHTIREAIATATAHKTSPSSSGRMERRHVLAALERTYPGITRVARAEDGAIAFDAHGDITEGADASGHARGMDVESELTPLSPELGFAPPEGKAS